MTLHGAVRTVRPEDVCMSIARSVPECIHRTLYIEGCEAMSLCLAHQSVQYLNAIQCYAIDFFAGVPMVARVNLTSHNEPCTVICVHPAHAVIRVWDRSAKCVRIFPKYMLN